MSSWELKQGSSKSVDGVLRKLPATKERMDSVWYNSCKHCTILGDSFMYEGEQLMGVHLARR